MRSHSVFLFSLVLTVVNQRACKKLKIYGQCFSPTDSKAPCTVALDDPHPTSVRYIGPGIHSNAKVTKTVNGFARPMGRQHNGKKKKQGVKLFLEYTIKCFCPFTKAYVLFTIKGLHTRQVVVKGGQASFCP